ncbi:MAG: hypothetical protein KBT33_00230 [Prevotellaceae bacterium]|nr:hypothetical protein [Candidatus Minthosoma equi]
MLALLSACSSTEELEKVENEAASNDPLVFTCIAQDAEQAQGTRAVSSPLTSDFMVSTYKAFAKDEQQTVMSKYRVEYKTSGSAWDGTVRPYWDYTTVSGQYEKYWDYSNYPYRFNAIAPCPGNTTKAVLNDKQLTINVPYKMQSCLNGQIIPADAEAEPYLVAQVQRNTNGKDYDLMTTTGKKEININTATLNRSVALPFHHLNSKVRFGVYTTSHWATANDLFIKDLIINVSSDRFATNAVGYNATSTDGDYTWYRGTNNSGFTGVSQASAIGTRLLQFDGGKDIEDNNLSKHQGRSSAYWLLCQNGIMQIPQEQVQMTVSFKLYKMDGTLYKAFSNVPVKLDDDTQVFDWKSGNIYTYYLIVTGIDDKLEINFTATLTPWDDVSGILNTDLEK